MKVIKNEIRPIGFVTLELTEREVEAIYNMFWMIGRYRDEFPENMLGTQGELYQVFKELLEVKK